MDFSEKLQRLRKARGLTQEQLAEQLFVSRTAVSKWESGKGYPNLDSLQGLSRLFAISIDELLSKEERITLAGTENRASGAKRYRGLFCGMDLFAAALIFLPLYPNPVGDYIYSVSLPAFTATTPANLAVYWVMILLLIGMGALGLAFLRPGKERAGAVLQTVSLLLGLVAGCFFAAAREPYAGALLFLLFAAKLLFWAKQKM